MSRYDSSIKRAMTIVLLGLCLSACVGLDKFSAEVERNIDSQHVDIEELNGIIRPAITPKQRTEMKARLADLSPEQNCVAIETVAPAILKFDALNTDAQLKLARCSYHANDLASARQRYTSVMQRTGHVDAIKGLGIVEATDGNPEKALQLLRQANSTLKYSDWQVTNAIGFVEDQLGNFKDAESAYQTASALDELNGAPLNNLGMSYLRQNRSDEAILAFKTALQRDPDLAVARLNLRIAHAIQGDYAVALAGAADAERAAVLNSAGTSALAKGDRETAIWLFQEALDANPVFYKNAYDNLERVNMQRTR